MPEKKLRVIVATFLLSLYVAGGFFTWYFIDHQQQNARAEAQENARETLDALEQLARNRLNTTALSVNALSLSRELDPPAITRFIEANPRINQIFILENNSLVYPFDRPDYPLSQKEKHFLDQIASIIADPSLLNTGQNRDNEIATSGWFLAQITQRPALIYWQKQGNRLIGFDLNYSVFRAEFIADLGDFQPGGNLRIFENGQLLVSKADDLPDGHALTEQLPYPLHQWQIRYAPEIIQISPWVIVLLSAIILGLLTLITALLYIILARHLARARQQVQFVGQVSHELKTPLTNIRLYSEMLQEHADLTSAQRRYLHVIDEEGQRLTRLIQNVLNFTRQPRAHQQPVNLPEWLERLRNTFAPSFATHGMTLSLRISPDIRANPMIHSDPDLLTQIIGNFLSNAEKYAKSHTQVDLYCEMAESRILIGVRDYGAGISATERRKVLQPFYRISNAITEGVAGTGIGLTIAAQLADILSARIVLLAAEPGLNCQLILPPSLPTNENKPS